MQGLRLRRWSFRVSVFMLLLSGLSTVWCGTVRYGKVRGVLFHRPRYWSSSTGLNCMRFVILLQLTRPNVRDVEVRDCCDGIVTAEAVFVSDRHEASLKPPANKRWSGMTPDALCSLSTFDRPRARLKFLVIISRTALTRAMTTIRSIFIRTEVAASYFRRKRLTCY